MTPQQQQQNTAAPAEPAPQTETLLDQIVGEDLQRDHQRFEFAQRFAEGAARSNYFDDARAMPQALMKIMAGYELGLQPMVSLMHVHVIKGKVSLDGHLVATLLRRAGYTWQPLQHDEQGAEFLFFKNGKMLMTTKRQPNGELTEVPLTIAFTRKHAEDADLTGPRGEDKPGQKPKEKGMYEKYPRNMFFNRVITNFQRWHAPEVTSGITVYTPEELGATVDGDGSIVAAPAPVDTSMPRRKSAEEAA